MEQNFINLNWKLYIEAESVLDYLKYVFEGVRGDCSEDISNNIEGKIDLILEEIEFIEGN
jgi:hypothetical protein